MTRGEIFFVVGISVIEILALLLCFQWSRFQGLQKRNFFPLVLFGGVQIICLFLILLGGYMDKQTNFYDELYARFLDQGRISSEIEFDVQGDPDLLRQVRYQRPRFQRPDIASARELREWQESLRQLLLDDVFKWANESADISEGKREISSTIIEGDIKRTFLTFESFDGTSIPGYLFTPPVQGPKPAIIVLSGHVPDGHSGLWQVSGLVDSYQHKVALRLAKAGFLTLAIEFRGFGLLGAPLNTEHTLIAYNAILAGSFYKALLTKDIYYAFRLLESMREEVDSQRIGITGVSYGGEMAVTYAALDRRIKAIVSQGYGGQLGSHTGVAGTRKNQPDYCQIIPGVNEYFFREDLLFLIAPRPHLSVRGNEEIATHQNFFRTIEEVYGTLNAKSKFKFEIHHGGHEYFVEPAIQFFNAHL